MNCTDVGPLLDDYIDGLLPPERVREVEGHLAGCESCRREVGAIRSVLADARALPRSIQPGKDLWSGIEPRLNTAPVIPLPATALRSYRPFTLLAAALFLLIAGATLATLFQRRSTPSVFAAEQQRYVEATADLARKLADDPAQLSASTRAVVERNLAIVDQAIKEAEEALASDPGNTELEQMVLARYAQRLDLLKRATAAGKQVS
jgi:hypothetical protein